MKSAAMDFGDIPLDRGEIYRTMGYGDHLPDAEISEQVERTLGEIAAIYQPAWGYEIVPAEAVAESYVSAQGQKIATGRIISSFLRGSRFFALFVATAGAGFDQWMSGIRAGGDILSEFTGDAIGSEIAEAAARHMAAELAKEAGARGLRISNSYSPGYCGWNIREQRTLFSLLPASPCGITLTESCLMLPIKSVSGIIGIGPDMEKQPYSCDICDMATCYKKRSNRK